MATRDDGLRSEITDLLLDAEHRDELQRVGVWAFDHVAKERSLSRGRFEHPVSWSPNRPVGDVRTQHAGSEEGAARLTSFSGVEGCTHLFRIAAV